MSTTKNPQYEGYPRTMYVLTIRDGEHQPEPRLFTTSTAAEFAARSYVREQFTGTITDVEDPVKQYQEMTGADVTVTPSKVTPPTWRGSRKKVRDDARVFTEFVKTLDLAVGACGPGSGFAGTRTNLMRALVSDLLAEGRPWTFAVHTAAPVLVPDDLREGVDLFIGTIATIEGNDAVFEDGLRIDFDLMETLYA